MSCQEYYRLTTGIPVVFMVLPVTVVFAVYPGLAVLSLDLP